ncbi:MAG: hypothetical protein F4Z31_13140 [Gemmatimonadetes bacterium]|nr:hypothetical protein [Gemmatimonadota bacterium]MYE95143.1 hypothetical protein [Gemmatimonadota bacterium]MYJ09869.1 hypothetical protein [Gemmatimonadota bacterium]
MTSNPNDWTARLRSRLEADRRQVEEAAASELKQLGENLRAVANGALLTIEIDTERATARTNALLLKTWLRPLVVGLSLFLGISLGSWALTRWLSAGIQSRIDTRAALDFQIEEARETLAGIEETTWGVTLVEIGGDRFVVLPHGTLANPPWTVDGRPALKLSSD